MNNFSREELEQALLQCEAEPIHQCGQIQPHGALLVLSSDSQRIVLQASRNLADFIDLPADGAYDLPLAGLIGAAGAGQVEQLIKNTGGRNLEMNVTGVTLRQEKMDMQARVFFSGLLPVLELMPDVDDQQGEHHLPLPLQLQRSLFDSNVGTNLYQYFDRVALAVRELTGFDRVMVYRFDVNWDGEVIAESRVEAAHPYLGTRFPAGDIPPQARRLYTTNLVRQIADTNAKPVPVLPVLNPATRQPLDMTHSTLRSLSPIHVEYLRNMEVQASMSISLLQNGRLWGLIACHHMMPKRMSYDLQKTAVSISQIVSAKLSLNEFHELKNLRMVASGLLGELLEKTTADSENAIFQRLLPDLLGLLDATGALMVVKGRHYMHGEVPDPTAVSELLVWLGSQPASEIFCCDHLAQQFAPAAAYADIAAGLLATPLSSEMGNCILWFRKEKLRTVHWAGNPGKIFSQDPAGVHLSPRNSFEAWTETWRGRSASWSHIETEIAKSVALVLTHGQTDESDTA